MANDEDDRFVTSVVDAALFTYRMVLGDFDTTAFGNINVVLVWILFLACTLFNLIILLNLLISIISETFSVVKNQAESATY